MQRTPPIVSALILNYGSGISAADCAKHLAKQTMANSMEILVIDNHSEDDSIGILRNSLVEVSNVRILETPMNRGFGYGYNRGASYAHGKYLLINNPDKRLDLDGVEQMVRRMEADPRVGILGPAMFHDDGSKRLSIRRDPTILSVLARRSILGRLLPNSLRQYLMLDAESSLEQEVDWVVGGCFMIRRELFVSLGGFDERFFLFFEDTDLCKRVRGLGKTIVYFPHVISHDRKRRLSGETFNDLLFTRIGHIHMRSALKFFWKWRKPVEAMRSTRKSA